MLKMSSPMEGVKRIFSNTNSDLREPSNSEGEGHGETDIAHVEHGRMHDQTKVLQQRIEVAAIQRGWIKAQERIGGDIELPKKETVCATDCDVAVVDRLHELQ